MSFTAGSTGGNYKHKLSKEEMPKHSHGLRSDKTTGSLDAAVKFTWGTGYTSFDYHSVEHSGGNQAHNNIQPYSVAYMWLRTA